MKKSKRAESSAESTPKMDASSKERTDHLADREGRPIKVADAPAIQAHVRVPEAVDKGKWLKRQSSRRRSSVSALSRRDSEDHGSRGDGAASYRKSSSPRPDRRPRLSVSPPPRQLKGSVDSTTSPIATEASVASTPRPSFMSTSPGRQQQQQQEKEGGRGRAAPRAATDVSDSRGRRLGSAASGRSTEEARPLAGTHPSSSSSSSSSRSPPPPPSSSSPPLPSSSSSPALRCSVCRANFTAFLRPHRCRKCGETVCATCSPARTPKRTCKRCVGDSEEPLVLAVASPHPPAVAVPFPTTVQATGLAMAARRTEGSGDSASKVEVTSKTVTVVAPAASVSQAAVTGAAAGAAAAAAASGAGPPTLTCSFDHAEHMKKEGEERASSIAQGARSDVEGEIPEVAEDGEVAEADQRSASDETRLEVPEAPESSEGLLEEEGAGHAEEGEEEEEEEGAENVEGQEEGEKEEKEQSHDGEGGAKPEEEVGHTVDDGASEAGGDADGSKDPGEEAGVETDASSSQRPSFTKDTEDRADKEHVVEESGGSDFVEGGASDGHDQDQDQDRTIADPPGGSAGGESGQAADDRETANNPSVPRQGGEKREKAEADSVPEEDVGEGADGLDHQEPDGDPAAAAPAAARAGAGDRVDAEPATSKPSEVSVATPGPHDGEVREEETGVKEEDAQKEEGEKVMEDDVAAPAEDENSREVNDRDVPSLPQNLPRGEEERGSADAGSRAEADSVSKEGVGEGAAGSRREGLDSAPAAADKAGAGDAVDDGPATHTPSDALDGVSAAPQDGEPHEEKEEKEEEEGVEEDGSACAEDETGPSALVDTAETRATSSSQALPLSGGEEDEGPGKEAVGDVGSIIVAGEVIDDGYAEDDERMLPEPAGDSVGLEGDSSEDVKDGEAATCPQTLPQGGEMREAGEADSAADGGIGGAVEGALAAADEGTSTDEAHEEKPSTSHRSDPTVASGGPQGEALHNKEEEERDAEREADEELEDGVDGNAGDAAASESTTSPHVAPSSQEEQDRGQTQHAVEEAGRVGAVEGAVDGGYEEDDERMLPDTAATTVEGGSKEAVEEPENVGLPPVVPEGGEKGEAAEESAGGAAEGFDREGLEGVLAAAAAAAPGADDPVDDEPATHEQPDAPVATAGLKEKELEKEEEDKVAKQEMVEKDTHASALIENTDEAEDLDGGNVIADAPESETSSSPRVARPSMGEEDKGQAEHAVEEAGSTGGVGGAVDGGCEEDDERMLPDAGGGSVDVEGESGDEAKDGEVAGVPQTAVLPDDEEMEGAADDSAARGKGVDEAAEGFDHKGLDGALATPGGAGADDPADDEPPMHEGSVALVAAGGEEGEEMQKEEVEEEKEKEDKEEEDQGKKGQEKEPVEGGDASEPVESTDGTVHPSSRKEEDRGQTQHAVEEASRVGGAEVAADGGYEKDDERMLPHTTGTIVEGGGREEANKHENAGSIPVVPAGGDQGEGAEIDPVKEKGVGEAAETDPVAEEAVGGAAEGSDHEGLDGALASAGGVDAGGPVDDEPATREQFDAVVAAGGAEGGDPQKEEEEDKEDKVAQQVVIEEDDEVSAPVEEADRAEDMVVRNDDRDATASEMTSSAEVSPSSMGEEDKGQAEHVVEEAGSTRGVGGAVDGGYEEDDERMLLDAAGRSVNLEGGSREEVDKREHADSRPVIPEGGERGEAAEESAGEAAEGFDHEGIDGVLAAATADADADADAGGTGVEDDVDTESAKEERKDLSSVVATIPNHDEEGQHKDGEEEEEEEEEEREEGTGAKREDRREGDGSSTAGVETSVERGMGRQREEQGNLKSPPVFRDSQAGGGGSEKEEVEEEGPGEASKEEEEVVAGTRNTPGGSYDDVPEMTQLEAMKAPAFGLPGGEQGDAVVM
ncbi:unnamed protein product, partial [Scytosiphon promiscuus]